ncbi:AAA family ATPase [Acidithiobacillus thiooxidans]|uniref:AAA family ATPase n=1 Tax=Acidithiobacillus thiooxidans TaxID=930 RepID=UPI001C0693DD|nr:AAA family ATPase [Acidithiobacillus thiooxidans]MBU2792766.1 AAA family ATPase [Acidithiobacillus thiooxidans]
MTSMQVTPDVPNTSEKGKPSSFSISIPDLGEGKALSLENILKLDSYSEYRSFINIMSAVMENSSHLLRKAMLHVIIKYADDVGVMRRLLFTDSLPWSKIHGKYLCKLYMKNGINENHPFSMSHIVFPEVYMHKLIRDRVTFEAFLKIKQVTDAEMQEHFGEQSFRFHASNWKIVFLMSRRDEFISRMGYDATLLFLVNAFIQRVKSANVDSASERYIKHCVSEVQDILFGLNTFPSRSASESVMFDIMAIIDALEKMDPQPFGWEEMVATMLPKPLSADMLSNILENAGDKLKWYMGRHYTEWDSNHIVQIQKADKRGDSILRGIQKNTILVTPDIIDGGVKQDAPLKLDATQVPTQNLSVKIPAAFSGMSLRVVQNFKANPDDRAVKAYNGMSGKDIPLIAAPDPEMVFSCLDRMFPWAQRANEIICRQISMCRMGRGYVYINPLLLIGRPGVGKTRYSQMLAKILGIPMTYYGAGGSMDVMLLKGSARGWSNTRPSLALETIRQHNIANPMILVDEIDKAGSGTHNGRVEDYLHNVLEPSSARSILDECLMVPVDLSAITWVLTANYKEHLSGSLLSRLLTIEIPAPSKQHHETVVHGVISSVMEEYGIHTNQLPDISDMLWATFMESASNPRTLRKMVGAWIGEVGRQVVIQ